MVRVVVSDTKVIDLAGQSALEGVDATVERTGAKAPDEVIRAAAGADALVVDAGTRVTVAVFEALDSLSVIGRAGTGVDNIDLAAAERHGVPVVNVPDYATEEVATHALSLLLACLRQIPAYDRSVRDREWDWTVGRPIDRLAGGTVGVVGFGAIGRRFVRKLRGFDVDVVAHDPYVAAAEIRDRGARKVSFERLLGESDAVSVHAPLTEETRGMIDAEALAATPDGAILVNTARGPVVDEDALEDALRSGTIGAAGLDVRDTEPPESTLADLEAVVSTPHAGWYSERSRAELNRTVAADVARVLRGDRPRHPVDAESRWS
jgi:D-3-phosphoglycerate dehydrogenase